MAKVIDEAAELITGLKSKDNKWEWCVLQNSSAPGGVKWSCPMDDMWGSKPRDKVAIAVYNPSLVTKRVISIPVVDGLYNVSVYHKSGGQFISENFHTADGASVLCDYYNPHNQSACVLYVNYTIPGQQIGFIFLTRNLT